MNRLVFSLLSVVLSLILFSCDKSVEKNRDTIPLLKMRNMKEYSFDKDSLLKTMVSDIKYIQLETTEESFIANILDACITTKYIFILPTKSEYGVLQFDREGKYIKRFARRGNGPGEIGLPQTIYTDDKEEFLYISDFFALHKYDMNGNFIEKKEIQRPFGYQYLISKDLVAEVGREYVPFAAPGMFGLGIFNLVTQDTIAIKSNFLSTKVPLELTGIKQVSYSNSSEGLLVKLACNDTVFNLTPKGIIAAYVFNTENSEQYNTSSFNIKDNGDINDTDIQVWDFCEINDIFMYRTIMNNHICMYIYNKETEQYYYQELKYDPNDIIMYNRSFSIAGLYLGKELLPFSPYRIWPQKQLAVQYYTADEIIFMKKEGELSNTKFESIDENSNPVLVIYTLKKH